MTAYAGSAMLKPGDWPLINAGLVFDTRSYNIFYKFKGTGASTGL